MADLTGFFLIMICVVVFFVTLFICLNDYMNNGPIYTKWISYKQRNALRKCRECNRLYRKYQIDLVIAAKGHPNCPHCGKYISYIQIIEKPDKWMDTHPDCMKINLLSYLKIIRAIKTVKKLNHEKASIERFEKYNNLEPNMDWIKKLQKDMSK